MSLSSLCKEAYDRDGYGAVFELVHEAEPMRAWHMCDPCEMITPTDDDKTCLVCWSVKTEDNLKEAWCSVG